MVFAFIIPLWHSRLADFKRPAYFAFTLTARLPARSRIPLLPIAAFSGSPIVSRKKWCYIQFNKERGEGEDVEKNNHCVFPGASVFGAIQRQGP
jgi:hypothetical protein